MEAARIVSAGQVACICCSTQYERLHYLWHGGGGSNSCPRCRCGDFRSINVGVPLKPDGTLEPDVVIRFTSEGNFYIEKRPPVPMLSTGKDPVPVNHNPAA